AVASTRASTVARDRCCEASFRGFVAGLRIACGSCQCEYWMRAIARILFRRRHEPQLRLRRRANRPARLRVNPTLQRLFRYKAWANDALLTRLAEIGPTGFGDLALKALGHTYVVDRIFAAHLRRHAHAYRSGNPAVMPTLERVSADIGESDREYVDYVASLDADALAERIDFTFTDGAPGRMSREEMLMHVITHGIGHRGQVSALMLLNGVAPSNDGLTTYLHEAEKATRRR
ncbi:MAG TPA: DinB family protein, partial [Dokdonella sp.]|nr:DinB family protein [Dokdonella sp.]